MVIHDDWMIWGVAPWLRKPPNVFLVNDDIYPDLSSWGWEFLDVTSKFWGYIYILWSCVKDPGPKKIPWLTIILAKKKPLFWDHIYFFQHCGLIRIQIGFMTTKRKMNRRANWQESALLGISRVGHFSLADITVQGCILRTLPKSPSLKSVKFKSTRRFWHVSPEPLQACRICI